MIEDKIGRCNVCGDLQLMLTAKDFKCHRPLNSWRGARGDLIVGSECGGIVHMFPYILQTQLVAAFKLGGWEAVNAIAEELRV